MDHPALGLVVSLNSQLVPAVWGFWGAQEKFGGVEANLPALELLLCSLELLKGNLYSLPGIQGGAASLQRATKTPFGIFAPLLHGIAF